MTFAYMYGGKEVEPSNAGITTDLLKVVSLSGMCIPAIQHPSPFPTFKDK